MSDLVRAADVEPRSMRLLWRDRLPAATLSVIAGPPGLGKSSLLALAVAELTRAGHTILLSNAEDDVESVTRPRLDVAGAILERVHIVPPDSTPVLPAELATLRGWVRETGATVCVLDPIAAHFNPERRVHDRGSLRKLTTLGRATGCAFVGVHHTTKTFEVGGPNAGLLGTSRAVYVYGYDPEDEDARALSCVKANGFDEPPALLIGHETVEYTVGRRTIEAGKVRILGQSNVRARGRRGRRNPQRDAECHEWLSNYLAGGEDCARKARAVREEGLARFGWPTIQRAKVALEVEHVREGFGGDGFWLWRLPDDHPLRTPADEDEAGVP